MRVVREIVNSIVLKKVVKRSFGNSAWVHEFQFKLNWMGLALWFSPNWILNRYTVFRTGATVAPAHPRDSIRFALFCQWFSKCWKTPLHWPWTNVQKNRFHEVASFFFPLPIFNFCCEFYSQTFSISPAHRSPPPESQPTPRRNSDQSNEGPRRSNWLVNFTLLSLSTFSL